MRNLTLIAAAAALSIMACRDSTSPSARVYLDLYSLETPASANLTDTVRVAFQYSAWCGPTPSIDLAMQSGRVDVAVWTTREALDRLCIAIYPLSVRSEILLPPRFLGAVQTEVRFRQPEGPDSVRTIVTAGVAARAP